MALNDYEHSELCVGVDGIPTLQQLIERINERHGWNDNVVNVPEAIALIHSELSEALEEYRKDAMMPEYAADTGKPEGFAIELADAIIRILHLSERLGMNMGMALAKKIEYNDTRPYRHGGKTC